jgi:uroporphyrinogen-III synthase
LASILVTRPEPDAAETAARLQALGIEAVTAPLLELSAVEAELPAADGFDAVVLTSINAVRALAGRGQLGPWLGLPAHCVGKRTAELAREAGFAKVASVDGGMENLALLLRRNCSGQRIFYPSGRQVSGDLAGAAAPDVHVERVAVYEMMGAKSLPPKVEIGLVNSEIGAALLYSRRSAEVFLGLAGGLPAEARGQIALLCLSEKVALPAREAGFSAVAVAGAPNEEAMLALAVSFSRGEISA